MVCIVFSLVKLIDGSDNKNCSGGSIGWLLDEYGVLCLVGECKFNVFIYLLILFVLFGVMVVVEVMVEGEMIFFMEGIDVIWMLMGDVGIYVLGKVVFGGMQEIINWVCQCYGQMFDVIYVLFGLCVVVYIIC